MRETEKRIKKYTARLPKVREKVMASLVLFIVATSMLTVATFSWITLSVAPEVTGIPTTIAANGNLEIALVPPDGSEPPPSEVGDSWLDLISRNIKWGNLVNLSDPAYGLENIVLRPAVLNPTDLLNAPLSAVGYTADGRANATTSDFNYTIFDTDTKSFIGSSDRGIRAISSVKYEVIDYDDGGLTQSYLDALSAAENGVGLARQRFNGLSGKMSGISNLIGTYMNGILRGDLNNEPCADDDVAALYHLMADMDENVMEPLGNTLMDLFVKVLQKTTYNLADENGQPLGYTPIVFTDLDDFCSRSVKELEEINKTRDKIKLPAIQFDVLSKYIAHRKTLKDNIAKLKTDVENYEMNGVPMNKTWKNVNGIANVMVDIASVELRGKKMDEWMGNLRENIGTLINILGADASANNVVIKKGLLKDMDALLHNGSGFYVSSIRVNFDNDALKAKVTSAGFGSFAGLVSGYDHVNANIRTSAVSEYPTSHSRQSLDAAADEKVIGIKLKATQFTAMDTYGLVLDFWLRTNNNGAYLLLEGDVVRESTPVTQTVQYKNEDGQKVTKQNVEIYSVDIIYTTVTDYTVETEEDKDSLTTETLEGQKVFLIDGIWYLRSSGEKILWDQPQVVETVTEDDTGTVVYTRTVTMSKKNEPVKDTEDTIVGYSGANRIWTDEQLDQNADYDPTLSTTQGGGSCYTFYATPENKEQSLGILSALKVAFVDGDGNKLATASFDTESHYEELGRVIVPMYLDSDSTTVALPSTEEGIDGDQLRVISPIAKNEPMMVTVIVYLDGTQIANEQVLAASEIDGTLNIQFGSYTRPEAMQDDKLVAETREIRADLVGEYNFTGKEKERPVTVALTISGTQPSKVEAYFTRVISKHHGVLYGKTPMVFTRAEDGKWYGTIDLMAHGEFVLRRVTIDGIEYNLRQEEETYPRVLVPGFGINSVSGLYGQQHVYQTADAYVTERFDIEITAAHGLWPSRVQGVFQNEEGATIITTYTGYRDEWSANVTFTHSGVYTMSSVIIDGEYYDVAPIEREVYVGMYTKVFLNIDDYDPSLEADGYSDEESPSLTTAGFSYFYDNAPHTFSVGVEIFDNAGNELEGLSGVSLQYSGNLYAELTWDSVAGRYTGEAFMVNKIGVYRFQYVAISGRAISKAQSALTITVKSKDPVSYRGVESALNDKVLAIGQTSAQDITLVFENAEAASVYGLFARSMTAPTAALSLADDGAGTAAALEYWVLLAENNEDGTHTFKVPAEDGYWQLMDVKVSTVFNKDANGTDPNNIPDTFYNGNPVNDVEATMLWPSATLMLLDPVQITDLQTEWYEFDEMAGQNGEMEYDHYYDIGDIRFVDDVVYTKVIADVRIDHNLDALSVTGGSYNTDKLNFVCTGTLLQPYTFTGLRFKVADFEGQSLGDADTVVSLKLKRGAGSSYTWGYYTFDGSEKEEVISLDESSYTALDQTKEVQGDITLSIAGEYVPVVTFELDGDTIEIAGRTVKVNGTQSSTPIVDTEEQMPMSIIIKSAKPEVVITGLTPQTAATDIRIYTSQTPANTQNMVSGTFADYNNYTETSALGYVYTVGTSDSEAKTVYFPQVSMELTGISTALTNVSLTVPNSTNVEYDNKFVFTKDANSNVFKASGGLGGAKQGTSSAYPVIYPAGHHKLTTFTVVQDGKTFTVDMNHALTITNPISPMSISFSISGNGYTGSVPATVYTTNGIDVTTKLPTIIPWEYTETQTNYQNQSAYTDLATKTVSKYDSGLCSGGGYSNYTRHERYYTVDEVVTTTTYTYQVEGWMIDGYQYSPGETVTFTSVQVAEAVIKCVNETTNTVTTKYKVTEYSDINQNDDTKDPKGTEVDTVYTSGYAEVSRVKQQ